MNTTSSWLRPDAPSPFLFSTPITVKGTFPIRNVYLTVRTAGNPAATASDVQRVVRGLDQSLPVYEARPMLDWLDSTVSPRRFTVMRELIAAAAGDVSECSARGTGRAARLLGLAYLGAWTSYYLAVGAGIDPWPIPVLDEMKRRLRAT